MSETKSYKESTDSYPPQVVTLSLTSIQRAMLALSIEDQVNNLKGRIAAAEHREEEADVVAHRQRWLAAGEDFLAQLKEGGWW